VKCVPDPNISQGFAWFLQSTLWKGQDRRSASCFAISVLPCPGGPEKRSTRGFSDSSVFIVWLATSPKICSRAKDWPNRERIVNSKMTMIAWHLGGCLSLDILRMHGSVNCFHVIIYGPGKRQSIIEKQQTRATSGATEYIARRIAYQSLYPLNKISSSSQLFHFISYQLFCTSKRLISPIRAPSVSCWEKHASVLSQANTS
jgi:hypothetical protein